MKYLSPLLILALITLSGCGSLSSQSTAQTEHDFVLTVEKPGNSSSRHEYTTTSESVNLRDILEGTDRVYMTDYKGNEVISNLDGIIATAARSWNVYIDDTKQTFQSIDELEVQKGSDITLRYE